MSAAAMIVDVVASKSEVLLKDELIISLGLHEPDIRNMALGLQQTSFARYEARTLPNWAVGFVEEDKEIIEVIGEKWSDF